MYLFFQRINHIFDFTNPGKGSIITGQNGQRIGIKEP